MRVKKSNLPIIFLLLLAFILRFYKIEFTPASLYYDEVDYAYQARSLIQTGRDYRGESSPFFVHSFNDIRAPIPAFLTVPATLIFSTPQLQVRMPNVILGTMIVLLVFLLVRLWSENLMLATLVAIIFATNPWQIQFSRFNHEVISMAVFYLLSLWCFYKWASSKRFGFLLAGAVVISLAVYTYRTMSLFVPLAFLILFLIYRIELLKLDLRKLSLLIIIPSVIMGSFLYATTIGAPETSRIAQLSITSDPTLPIWIQRNRELDSGDFENHTLGKSPIPSSYLFHNKLVSWINSFSGNYIHSFSTDFLLVKGDGNHRHSVGQMGEIYFIDAVGFIAGLFYLLRNLKIKHNLFLLIWLLTSPIPAALTFDGAGHSARLFIFSLPLLLTIGFGWWQVINILKSFKWGKIFLGLGGAVWLLLFIFYLHRYFIHYPIESARNFGYGFKQAVSRIQQEQFKYKQVVMVPTNDPPMIYFLFWSKTPPLDLQKYGSRFSPDIIKNVPLDKFKVVDLKIGDPLEENTLYLLTQSQFSKDLRESKNIPSDINLIDTIKYPDGEVAFYLVSKKTL